MRLIFVHRATATYALNVLLGALEGSSLATEFEIVLAMRPAQLITALRDTLARGEEALVLWSFYSAQFAACAAELREARRVIDGPGITHVAGGVHATAEPLQTLQAGWDLIAIGEGEHTLLDLLRRRREGLPLTETDGVAHLDGGRVVLHGQARRALLDDFPPFAYEHRKFNPIEITRGCIYGCKFCQTPFMFKAKFRHRSVENICYWLDRLCALDMRDVRFITPTALSYGAQGEEPALDRVEELLSSVQRVIGAKGRIFFGTFPSEIRPEHVTRPALALIKKYAFNRNIIIGGQSGSDRVLASSNRGHSAEQVLSAARLAREEGFDVNVDFIFGLPGESEDDRRASVRLAEELTAAGARIHGHTFMPLPGTPYKDAAAGQVDEDTRAALGKLSHRGKLYGQWERQQALAEELQVRRVRAPAPVKRSPKGFG